MNSFQTCKVHRRQFHSVKKADVQCAMNTATEPIKGNKFTIFSFPMKPNVRNLCYIFLNQFNRLPNFTVIKLRETK